MEYKKRILVTGGAGFIGSHVVILLVEKYPEYFIINLDKLDYCASTHHLERVKHRPNYKFIQGDICEPDFMRYIFEEEHINIVLHFAAQSHVDLSFWSSLDFTRTNVYGSHVLINAAHEAAIDMFIHASTDEVYGGTSTELLDEGSRIAPTNPYAASKAAAECIVSSYWQAFKFPVIITRSNNVYGPHQYPEKVIPKFICLLERNRKCCIHGKGDTSRHFVHASDLARAFDIIMHKGRTGETYNIGSDSEISVIGLVKYLMKHMKNKDSDVIDDYVEYVHDRPFNDLRYPMDSTKLNELGWYPQVSWDDGMKETISWYLDEDNFNSWPSAQESLSPYPVGSNTMRMINSKAKVKQYHKT